MDIISKLSEKISLCNTESVSNWWGVSGNLPPITVWDNDGCFLISEHTIVYCNFSIGRTQKISRKINPSNWDFLQKLYLKGCESKLFRIDLPTKREVIQIDGVNWEFTETVRPGSGNGENNFRLYTSVESISKELEGMFNLIKAASEISPTIPLFRFQQLRQDDQGFYFYTDWGDWIFTPEFVIAYNMHHMKHYSELRNWKSLEEATDYVNEIKGRIL